MAKRKHDDLLGADEPGDDFGFLETPDLESPPETTLPSSAGKGTRAKRPPAEEADQSLMPSAAPAPAATENYVVLARRYRPQTFNEIVGQEHVRKALAGAITSGQIAHAYLFCGPRGTGKTSSARILAKALNCQNGGPRPDPCGECASCRAITAGSSLDVIEIDAASNTGVDNIRELRSGVALAPFSRYKVYIVDEVHMLSMQAFNALLKTLEEPPPQVIFVLATTELQKVPETIVSRCQAFTFRRFSTAEIVAQLDKILSAELKRRSLSVSDEDRAKILELVARSAEGGMRDAQVTLDQVLVFSRGQLDFDSVRRFLGTVEAEVLDGFVRSLYERRADDLLLLIEELTATGQDLELFVKNLADYVRDLLILRTAPSNPELVTAAPDRHQQLRALANDVPAAFLLNLASTALKLSEEMKGSSQARFLLEFAVIRMTKVDPVDDISKIVARLQELEKRLNSGGGPGTPPAPQSPPGGGAGLPPRTGPVSSAPGGLASPAAGPGQVPQRIPPQQIRREAIDRPAAPVPAPAPAPAPQPSLSPPASLSETPAPAAPVAVSAPAPEEPPVSAPPPVSGPLSLEAAEFQKQLLEGVAARNAYGLHATLLETCLVSLTDSAFVLGAKANDRYTLAHLDTTNNQSMLRAVAQEVTGRELALRVQPVQEMTMPFTAVAAAGHTMPAAPPPRPAPRPVPAPAAPVAAEPRTSAPAPAGTAVPPVAQVTAEEAVDENAPRRVVFTAELRNASKAQVRGNALKQLLEKHTDLQELVDKVKTVFKVDDAQITFSRSIV